MPKRQGSAPNPVFNLKLKFADVFELHSEAKNLFDEFAHQIKNRPHEDVRPSPPRREKSDFFFWFVFFFASILKKKMNMIKINY